MTVERFCKTHIAAAQQLAWQEYQQAQRHFTAMPHLTGVTPTSEAATLPDLAPFAENGLGVAALQGGRLVGFLCVVSPFAHCFRSTDAVGVFSPLGANAAQPQDRAAIYAAMLEKAAEAWVKAGASNHAICLYAHDSPAQTQCFFYGYGLRCMDGIRLLSASQQAENTFQPPHGQACTLRRLDVLEFERAFPLEEQLAQHMAQSPTFIRRPSLSQQDLWQAAQAQRAQYYAALAQDGTAVAYLRASPLDGETFLRTLPGYIHLDGAFCQPAWRGSGLAAALLRHTAAALAAQGYTHLGVDLESINPAAHHFWRKHFQLYTHSLARRIDEHALPHAGRLFDPFQTEPKEALP